MFVFTHKHEKERFKLIFVLATSVVVAFGVIIKIYSNIPALKSRSRSHWTWPFAADDAIAIVYARQIHTPQTPLWCGVFRLALSCCEYIYISIDCLSTNILTIAPRTEIDHRRTITQKRIARKSCSGCVYLYRYAAENRLKMQSHKTRKVPISQNRVWGAWWARVMLFS